VNDGTRFPRGRLSADDNGELSILVGVKDGTVIIDFGGRPVTWLGMGYEQAKEFALLIARRAEEIKQ
jgi:hypothetical protein